MECHQCVVVLVNVEPVKLEIERQTKRDKELIIKSYSFLSPLWLLLVQCILGPSSILIHSYAVVESRGLHQYQCLC